MTQTIANLWNGSIAPCGRCGCDDAEVNDLVSLMERNCKALCDGLTAAQKEALQKYMDCSEEYIQRMTELAFCDGFRLGSRLAAESLL